MKKLRIYAGLIGLLTAVLFLSSCGKLYHVHYDRNGHGTTPKSTSFWENDGLTEENLPECEDEEYVFEYWYLKGDETQTKVTVGDHFAGDITLVAKWDLTKTRTKKVVFLCDFEQKNGRYNYRYKQTDGSYVPFGLTLKCDTAGATIHLTVDGKNEEVSSPYFQKLSGGTHTVTAYATSPSLEKSIVNTQTYIVDSGVTKITDLKAEYPVPDEDASTIKLTWTHPSDGDFVGECVFFSKSPDLDAEGKPIVGSDGKPKVYIMTSSFGDENYTFAYPNFADEFVISGLEAGIVYSFTVCPFDDFGNFQNSNVASVNVVADTSKMVKEVVFSTNPAKGASGRYKNNTVLTMSTETEGAEIYYTYDGTTPSKTNGEKYTGALSLPGEKGYMATYEFCAQAYLDGYSDSNPSNGEFVIDMAGPDKVEDLVASQQADGTVVLSWTNPTNDDFAAAYVYNGDKLLDSVQKKSSYTFTPTLGSYDLSIVTQDEYDNISVYGNTVHLELDKTPPAVVTDLKATTDGEHILVQWTNPTDSDLEKIELFFKYAGATSADYAVLATENKPNIKAISAYTLAIGDGEGKLPINHTYTFKVRGTDKFGNESESDDTLPDAKVEVKDTGAAAVQIR